MNAKETDPASGIQYALRILVGTSIVWFGLRSFPGVNPLWAVIPVIVVSETGFHGTISAFKSRVLNTVVGCVVALVFLALFGFTSWSILLAMALSVLAGSYLISFHVSWKVAPVTVAIIMVPGFVNHASNGALSAALWRTGEVLLGGGVAVGVEWLLTGIGRRYRPDETVAETLNSGGNANEYETVRRHGTVKAEAQKAGGENA